MQGTVVGVLRGGPSREHESSLKSGAALLAALAEPRYTAKDIYIDKQGVWHDRGRPVEPEKAIRMIDVALLALHGEYGESGEVQRFLELHGVRYSGADSFSTALSMHKVLAKEKVREAGLKVPSYFYLQSPDEAEAVVVDIVRKFAQPVVVKPAAWGSSVGVSLEGGYARVLSAIQHLFAQGAAGVIVEEYVRGKEASVGVIEDLRSEDLYALPVVEVVSPAGEIFSEAAKNAGTTEEVCPGRFHRKITEELQEAARTAHRALGLRDYSRSDFIVAPHGVYYLETNSPAGVGLTADSIFPKSLASVGITLPEFVDHLVDRARNR